MTRRDLSRLDELVDYHYGEDEQLWAFRQAFEDEIALPCEAALAGAPVQVLKFDYDGNPLSGLTAKCRGQGGPRHTIAAADVVFPSGSKPARDVAAYRKWLGIAPVPRGSRKPRHA